MAVTSDPKVTRNITCVECRLAFHILIPPDASGIDYCVCPGCSVMLELDYDQPTDHPIVAKKAEAGF